MDDVRKYVKTAEKSADSGSKKLLSVPLRVIRAVMCALIAVAVCFYGIHFIILRGPSQRASASYSRYLELRGSGESVDE